MAFFFFPGDFGLEYVAIKLEVSIEMHGEIHNIDYAVIEGRFEWCQGRDAGQSAALAAPPLHTMA